MHGLKRVAVLLFVLEIFLFLPEVVFGQEKKLIINEFSSASNPEWIEIYNTTTSPQTLEGCSLLMQDNPETTQKIIFDQSNTIDKFFLIRKGDFNWSANWLNDNGDKITLTCQSFEDSVAYGNATNPLINEPDGNQSAGRSPDGIGGWAILSSSTPGSENSVPPTLTPTSTQIPPTNTPQPTPTPTLTIPASTSTPVPPTLTPPTSYSNIYINEFLADPETGNEKVEIKNNNDFPVSLVNWKIDDVENDGKPPKPFSADIAPSGLFTIDLGDGFLNNNGDSVRLLDFNDTQKDKRDYSSSTKNLSWSKDRNGNWCQQNPSFNSENSDCQPVATSVPTPTSQPTATLTPMIRVSLASTPSPTIKPTDGEILGAEDASKSLKLALNDATDSSLPDSGDATVAGVAKSNKLPPSWPFIGIGSAFLAAMVGSAVIVVRKKLSLL